MKKRLTKAFFDRDTLLVTEELLGKFLVQKTDTGEMASMIIEVEAYDGPLDKASHASRGKTMRNAVMFGEAGVFYVYLCYGIHWMVNIVTGPREYPAAILIRGTTGAKGPGNVTKFFKINKSLGGKRAIPKNTYWFEDRGVMVNKKDIQRTPRVGVAYAGPIWANKKYRFILKSRQ